uniref:Neur_chan_LBD domain-containing protein n=1 Tax=Macrostomum lignano TaxID=282301 RepID=A0A1I8IB64_9PLAT
MMSDSLEAIPLNRDKLWTPRFVFLNARSLREEQNTLYMTLAGGLTAKAIVYRVWHRATVRCDGPALQYPLSDTLCSIVFEEASPRGQRSVHMSLGQHHQHNCSFKESAGRHAIVYRLSKPISSDGRKFEFWTRICIKSSLDDMSDALRQYCLSLILLLHSFATLYFFDRSTRLLINLALLHILLLNWQPTARSRISALDIWMAKCTLAIFCCLTVAMATTNEPANGEGGFGDAGTRRKRRQQQRDEQLSGRQSAKGSSGSCSGTFLMPRDPQTSSCGLRNSKCTTISECSDHLDLFPADEIVHHHHHHSPPAQPTGSSQNGGRGSAWQTAAKSTVPACWLILAAAFWACLLLTAARCDSLLPECHQRDRLTG